MKFENNWCYKTLEHLEKDKWKSNESDSALVRRIGQLRKIPLDDFSTEDLRLMIGQQFSLNYLIPLALETLAKELFAEGDMFEGDLLKNVLNVNTEFWIGNKGYWQKLDGLLAERKQELEDHKIDITKFYSNPI